MAKKKASTTRRRSPSRNTESIDSFETSSSYSEFDFKEKLRTLAQDPTVRYVAAGLATALLSRFATKIGDKYPEVSHFIKNNLNLVGDRFGIENQEGSQEADVRH